MSEVLLASGRSDDRRALEEILDGTAWSARYAPDLKIALAAVRAPGVNVVLCDRDFSGADWKKTIRELLHVRPGACVILISAVSDQYLWDEVVNLGGFDVLTRPLHREAVLAALDFAYTHAKVGWPAK